MDPAALRQKLTDLIATWENEVVEFKEASNSYPTSDIGKYFSALSNEANLKGADAGWLVFGVRNKSRTVVGSDYRVAPEHLQSLKQQIAEGADPTTTFRNIYEITVDGHRVVLMEIPPAPRGIPIAWQGHYFARAGESLSPLGLAKQDEIRAQTLDSDWSAQVVDGATLDDLDPQAVERARRDFALKHQNRIDAEEVRGWPVATLLDRAKVTQRGQVTRTALLLLGRAESAYLLSPHPAQITWKLVGQETAYEHFGPPFLLSTSQLYQRVRNIQLRLLPDDELLPHEVSKYDQKVVLEALHNCIAHQDYRQNQRIIVTERPDRLVFENAGHFYEGAPEDYVRGDKTPRGYRNPYLVQAMVELNMIDQMGYGIQRMYEMQRRRYLPMPDYEVAGDAVVMTLYGGVVDPAYTRVLMEHGGLKLADVLALDRVQKGLEVPDEAVRALKRKGLIEGRKPRYRVSSTVAAASGKKAAYIKTRAFDDQHYADMLVQYLREFGTASRKDVDDLLWDKLSDALDEAQKSNKIGNLLSGLRRKGVIFNAGSKPAPAWKLSE
ncbi:transcriptional regulator [Haematobacter massiliensis]|jgi:ATP-dependent DNA helicase RecG|uniref:Transcriptional regulator n=1 Tax=Haematobacter massiliensis TaxID=195105 RepID=A0A086XUU8_9RHOB|nr:RNA-binding domain-containing protein [Haematobacter massiliensis]KFI25798.1 transcriptional regulator [Haematobacter massiliensis]OWJ83783.1 transcriptional regulator [Haematobacter massiliensis]